MAGLIELLTAKGLPNWAQGAISACVVILAGTYVWTQVQPVLLPGDTYYTNYQEHAGQTPDDVHTFESEDGLVVTVHHYADDGCLLVLAPGRQPKWLPLADLAPPQFSAFDQVVTPTWVATLEAAQGSNCIDCYRGIHPGNYRSWYGDKRQGRDGQIWVEVYREFEDGDTHVQMQRLRDGYWNADLSGAPIVCWVYCPAYGRRHY